MPWSPRNCGLLAFCGWQVQVAFCIAKHGFFMAWYGVPTAFNAMHDA
ncbi:hypothetical protein C4J99_4675 [Pseudomonas synxantha]|nr:hypothetical protein C4J99_4675 [Pseudomonas synxantha]